MGEIRDSFQGFTKNALHDNDNRTVWNLLGATKVLEDGRNDVDIGMEFD